MFMNHLVEKANRFFFYGLGLDRTLIHSSRWAGTWAACSSSNDKKLTLEVGFIIILTCLPTRLSVFYMYANVKYPMHMSRS